MRALFCIVICFTLSHLTYAQWQPDVRLTNVAGVSATSLNNAKCIAVDSAGILYVVWFDDRDGNKEIYYKRSTDLGTSWSADIRLTSNPGESEYPSVSASGLIIHVVWHDDRVGNREIYYKRSTDSGINWSADIRLTDFNPDKSQYPVVVSSASKVHVIWHEWLGLNIEVYYKRSTDRGTTWETHQRLTNSDGYSDLPSIAVSGMIVHVAWYDNRDGNTEVYYKRSTDEGITWESDRRLTTDLGHSWYPSIAAFGSNVHIVWYDLRDGNWEIYYKRSADAGVSWEADRRLTNSAGNSLLPSLEVNGSSVHLFWNDTRDGGADEIYYKNSTNSGVDWSSDARLTNASGQSSSPSGVTRDTSLHVVWHDERNVDWEIYYKRNPTGNPITGIEIIQNKVLDKFSLFQNYPNPFNPSTTIEYVLPKTTFVLLRIYNVLGEEVTTLVHEVKLAGNHKVNWRAEGFSSGVYVYRLQAGSLVEQKKLILLR